MESKVVPFAELLGEMGRSKGTEGGQTVDRQRSGREGNASPAELEMQGWEGEGTPSCRGQGTEITEAALGLSGSNWLFGRSEQSVRHGGSDCRLGRQERLRPHKGPRMPS